MPHGTILVDQTGAIVNNVVVKDRVLLSEEGLVAVVLTIDKKNGTLLTSPDIISRGFIYMRDNEEIMNGLRIELKRAVAAALQARRPGPLQGRTERTCYALSVRAHPAQPDRHPGGQCDKRREQATSQGQAGRRPSGADKPAGPTIAKPMKEKTPEEIASEQQKRFEEMRARLLTQDARID